MVAPIAEHMAAAVLILMAAWAGYVIVSAFIRGWRDQGRRRTSSTTLQIRLHGHRLWGVSYDGQHTWSWAVYRVGTLFDAHVAGGLSPADGFSAVLDRFIRGWDEQQGEVEEAPEGAGGEQEAEGAAGQGRG